MAKNVKKRNWAFVLYPESAPENWMEELQRTGLQCAISPLHDKDINPDNTPKKAHYHVILTYSGPTSYNVVKALTDGFNQPIPQPLEQVRGYYRYLTHKDNPEKAQYDDREIKTINGFDIADFTELTRTEITQIKKSLQLLIRQQEITEYAELMDYLQDEDLNTEYEVASNNTYFFNTYITGRRNNPGKFARIKARENTTVMATPVAMDEVETPRICCPKCGSISIVKHGKTPANTQRWSCKDCGNRFA